jgi:hypothetical protein
LQTGAELESLISKRYSLTIDPNFSQVRRYADILFYEPDGKIPLPPDLHFIESFLENSNKVKV